MGCVGRVSYKRGLSSQYAHGEKNYYIGRTACVAFSIFLRKASRDGYFFNASSNFTKDCCTCVLWFLIYLLIEDRNYSMQRHITVSQPFILYDKCYTAVGLEWGQVSLVLYRIRPIVLQQAIYVSGLAQQQKIPFVYYSFSGNCAASVPISTFMCLWAIYMYIPRIGPHISCSSIGRSRIVEIYKWFTDTWMWKLGLLPGNSFSGNIWFEFLVLVLCSVITLELIGLVRADRFCPVRFHSGGFRADVYLSATLSVFMNG